LLINTAKKNNSSSSAYNLPTANMRTKRYPPQILRSMSYILFWFILLNNFNHQFVITISFCL